MASPLTPYKNSVSSGGGWIQLKYDSHIALHLGELWAVGDESCCNLVLSSAATRRLLERTPLLGLGVFTSPHPETEEQWATAAARHARAAHEGGQVHLPHRDVRWHQGRAGRYG